LREDAKTACRLGGNRQAWISAWRKEQSTMAILTAEAPVTATEAKPPAKTKESIRRRRGRRADEGGVRYFLVKASSPDKIELAEEAASEGEAMITSFRTGGSFAVVTEWKTTADLSNGQPVIQKEAVRKERT
jgi:hypothetical protein